MATFKVMETQLSQKNCNI